MGCVFVPLVLSALCCPQVTLLLHTFKEETKRSASQDHKFYSECAPCEVYDSTVRESLYFHHFVGKNFLFAAVVGYRKYVCLSAVVIIIGLGHSIDYLLVKMYTKHDQILLSKSKS